MNYELLIKKDKKQSLESGQMLLVILLVMIVGLTIGLFLIGRTTTDISTTTKITDSSRAFNAAEAGVEQILRTGIDTGTQNIATGVEYKAAVNSLSGGDGPFLYPEVKGAPYAVGESMTIWLAAHLPDGSIDLDPTHGFPDNQAMVICYAADTGIEPALGITYYYRDGTSYYASYTAADFSGRVAHATITVRNINIPWFCGDVDWSPYDPATEYNRWFQIQLYNSFSIESEYMDITQPIALRIRPLFDSAPIAIYVLEFTGPLPAQGQNITSTGNVGEITRKISVQAKYKANPSFMDYVLYSTGGGISKSN